MLGKIHILNAEVVKTLLDGCVTLMVHRQRYDKLCTVHHRMMLRVTDSCQGPLINHVVFYHDVVDLAGWAKPKAIGHERSLLWVGIVIRSAARRVYRRVKVGELERPPSRESNAESVVPRWTEKQLSTSLCRQ